MKNLKLDKLIIDVKVDNLNRAISFYKDILGLPLIIKEKDWASFETLGAEIHLYLYGGIKDGLEFRVRDIVAQVEVLKKRGVSFFHEDQPNLIGVTNGIMEFPWGKSVLFKDSEGNQLALVED